MCGAAKCSAAWLLCFSGLTHAGAPTPAEPGWNLLTEVVADGPRSPRLHPLDGSLLWVSDASVDALFRYSFQTLGQSRLATYDRPSHLLIDPVDGDVFVSEPFDGGIFRFDWASRTSALWVAGFATGDDDPTGMAIVPAGYAGPLASPGDVLSLDAGANNPDGIWRWSTSVAEGEVLVLGDDEPYEDLRDIAVTQNAAWLADGAGDLWRIGAAGTVQSFATTPALSLPLGVIRDPSSDDLFVYDNGNGTVYRVDPATGTATVFFSGVTVSGSAVSPFSISEDGRMCVLADYAADRIYVFAKCDDIRDPLEDCNDNGIRDLCEFEGSTELTDCNRNGIADACEISSGMALDCNLDGIPDDCPTCPPVDIVFVMDTSSSMNDEASVICATVTALADFIADQGIDLHAEYFGISETPGGAFGCLTDTVINRFGTTVPGMPPAGNETLGECPGGSEVASEDWARASAVAAAGQPWRPGALRIVVPISDEGPWCGDPVNVLDDDATFHAISVALTSDVILSPILGTGSSAAVIARGQLMAESTGGAWARTTDPDQEIYEAISNIILDACFSITDCNGNGVPDECDIAAGTSVDVDPMDGVPDECQVPRDCNGNGIVDAVEIFQGLLPDCNGNGIADECDVLFGVTPDCNSNGLPDSCDLVGTGFAAALSENTTGAADATFLGAPDDVYYGLGGQIVTYDLTGGQPVRDGAGPDFNVYEVDTGAAEFNLVSVSVSADGSTFFAVDGSAGAWVPIPGDTGGGGSTGSFTRSYDLAGTGLSAAWYVRLDGAGTGAAGTSSGFDLDAIGIINGGISGDANGNGVPDECDCRGDADGNGTVDFNDLNLLLDHWGEMVPVGQMGDVDFNGAVNFADLNVLLDAWGSVCHEP